MSEDFFEEFFEGMVNGIYKIMTCFKQICSDLFGLTIFN